MSSKPRKVVILDPGRAFGSLDERAFSDHVALGFYRLGWDVDWHIDTNDAFAPRPYARLWRTLRPVPTAAGLAHAADPEPPLSDDGAPQVADGVRSGSMPAKTELVSEGIRRKGKFAAGAPKRGGFTIAALDRWARTTWHKPGAGPAARLAALSVWAPIRVYYRVRLAGGVVGWKIRETCRSAAKAVYWKAVFPYGMEPAKNLSKAMYWNVLHTGTGFLARAAQFAYWRGLYPYAIIPARATLRWSFWTLIEPLTAMFRRPVRRLGRGWGDMMEKLDARSAPLARKMKRRAVADGKPDPAPDGKAQALAAVDEIHIDDRYELFHGFAAWLKHELAHRGAPALVVLPCVEAVHFEALLSIVPVLGIDRPLDVPVVACLAGRSRIFEPPGASDGSTLARRLASGSPFARIFMFDRSANAGRGWWHGLAVAPLDNSGNSERSVAEDDGTAAIASAFVRAAARCASGEAKARSPALSLTEFGPLAIVGSALWGRVGSSTIFDSQVRVLVGEGYRVARFYFDHWPHYGEDRLPRIARMVAEDQQNVRPHYHVVFERNEAGRRLSRLYANPEFLKASPVRRMCMLLADPVTTDRQAAAFLARCADVAIVNHLPHLDATRQLTAAPIILETHDVFSSLLDVHGIPGFVPVGPDNDEGRLAEEKAAWAAVDFCINLSPEDHAAIFPYAKSSAYVRPYRDRIAPSRRSWPEVAHANGISGKELSPGFFDIMLWGSWHENNVQSVKWFLEEVRPLLGRHADARIIVAGKVVEGLGRSVRSHPDVVFCKFVDRLEDIASRSQVLVIPDQGGTGICVKAMDALAWGRPFAATRYGMRGTDLTGAGYVPAEGARALADDVAALLGFEAERRKRQEAGNRLFERNYSRHAYREAFRAVLDKVNPSVAVRTSEVAFLEAAPPAAAGVSAAGDRRWRGDPALSVVVATYDRYDVLPDAIASLRRQNVARGFLEIIVVDNSPDQARAARIADHYAGVEGIRYILEPSPGLSNARNVGTEAARGGIVAFIDDDAIADGEWARELVEAFTAFGESAGIVGGQILPRWVTPRPAWLPDKLISHLSIVDWGGDSRQLEPDKWVAGCNIAFRKSILRSVGGFSRALGRIGAGLSLLSNDETEVAAKIQALGYVTVYAPRARVDHVIDPSRLKRQWFRRRAAWQAVSDFISDSEAATGRLPGAIDHVRWALMHRKSAAPLGFYGVAEDAEAFQQDAGLVYDFVKVVLSGGVEVAVPGKVDAETKGTGKSNGATLSVLPDGTNARRVRRKRRPAPDRDAAKPAVSVVVATYDRYGVLGEAIFSLLNQDIDGHDLEIIVVDNSLDQEEAARFARQYEAEPRISYVLEPRPGLSNARNVGVAHARGDIVAFVDDDAIAAPDWARRILAAFGTASVDVAVVGGRILPRWVQPKPAWLADSLLGYLSIVDWAGGPRPLKNGEWLAGCNMAFDKAELLRAGGFSAALGRIGSQAALLSNDDTEVIERVKALGKAVLYEPRALVEHVIDPERLSRQWFRRRSAWQAASDFIKDSKEAGRYAEVAARRLFNEASALSGVPGLGFFKETNDPEEFAWQVGIMYDLTLTSLVGGEEIDPEGHLVMSGDIRQAVETRVKAKVRAIVHPGSRIRRLVRSIRRA